jgi:hypothetical protein
MKKGEYEGLHGEFLNTFHIILQAGLKSICSVYDTIRT